MELAHLDFPFDVKEVNEDGTFWGYGSTFGGKPDSHRDIIQKGAFTETLAKGGRNGSGIPMLWQHRSDQLPGVWLELIEDSKGLKSHGQLALDSTLGKDIHSVMKLGMEKKSFRFGQSIGYDAVEYEIDEKKKTRLLKKIDLWELSIVTFPANIRARVESVKAKAIHEARTKRELEKALREAGHSRSDAKYLASLVNLRDAEAEGRTMSGGHGLFQVLEDLQAANDGFRKGGHQEEPSGMLGILQTLKAVNS